MNYGELKAEWQYALGVTDNNNDILPGLINRGLRDVSNRSFFDFYKKQATLPITARRTSGTVAVTNGSASITFSSTTSAGMVGQAFQVASTDEWYVISAVSGTGGTLNGAYVGSTNGSASYTVWFNEISLPADYSQGSLKQVWLQDPEREVKIVYEDALQRSFGNWTRGPGTPEFGTLVGDAKLQLYPFPTGAGNLLVNYYRVPTEMADSPSDSATIDLPAQYHDAILHWCLFNHASGIRDSVASGWKSLYESTVSMMQYRHALKHGVRLRAKRWSPRRASRVTVDGELS